MLLRDYIDGCCHLCDFHGEFKAIVYTSSDGSGVNTYKDNCMYRCDGCGLLAHRLCHSERSKMLIEDRIPLTYCHCQQCKYKIVFSNPEKSVRGNCKYFCDTSNLIKKMNGTTTPELTAYCIRNYIDYVVCTDFHLRDDKGDIALRYNRTLFLEGLFDFDEYESNYKKLLKHPPEEPCNS